MVMFPLDAYCYHCFAFFLHCSQLFRVGHCVMAPSLETPCSIQRQIQREILFCLEITTVLGQKICQNGDRFTVVNFFFYYLIKCRFDSVVSLKCCFDQVSFRSNVASIDFCFDQMSFRSNVVPSTVVRSTVVRSTVGSRQSAIRL